MFSRVAQRRSFSCATRRLAQPMVKEEGDISSVFPSLSGKKPEPLPPRFSQLKKDLVKDPASLEKSWRRLLESLQKEVEIVRRKGSSVIPSIKFCDLDRPDLDAVAHLRERGVAVVRGVVSSEEALDWKRQSREYIQKNPSMKAFPAQNPAVFESYWSPPQLKARSHPSMLKVQRFLNSLWHSSDPETLISTRTPVSYADRLRIRQPGDAGFALGPHVDGGSIEKWEDSTFRQAYEEIISGNWENHDPWDARFRVNAIMDLYNGAGTCSMFRTFQGWLALSTTAAWEGTLLVNPMLKHAAAYIQLRPFFKPNPSAPENLDAWIFDEQYLAEFPSCVPGTAQELNATSHPHLCLEDTMTHIPKVQPGDYVAWHCDTIHAVDAVHNGQSDSSVFYIPTAPLCEVNARYLVRQRESFLQKTPPPDFPGGDGEKHFAGPGQESDIEQKEGLQAMGLGQKWEIPPNASRGEAEMIRLGNEILQSSSA